MAPHRASPFANSDFGDFQPETMRARRILVVDNDVDVLRASTELLTHAGFRVHPVMDGAAAWEALQENTYELLLTDNEMPNFSGLDLIRKLRSEGIALPVILASALPDSELKAAPSLEITAILTSPLSPGNLLLAINLLLSRPATTPNLHIEHGANGVFF